MAPNKRTEFQAERDREEIARRYLHGESQQVITDYLNQTYYSNNPLSRQQISYDIRLLIGRWERASLNKIDTKKAIELAKVDDLEVTYREAWERSLLDAETEITEQTGERHKRKAKEGEEPETVIIPERIKKYKRVEGQSGNPAFLQGVEWCIERRCKILGIDAPQEYLNIDFSQFTREELVEIRNGKAPIVVLLSRPGRGSITPA